ncbi:hypothetical protein QTP86_010603 [Hemibagrus guttatus]|nr:hypothetical protein QTP86_010603 [Hemibagrus guttatus]
MAVVVNPGLDRSDREPSSIHWEPGRERKGEGDEDKEEAPGNAFVRTFSFLCKMTSSRKNNLKVQNGNSAFSTVVTNVKDTMASARISACLVDISSWMTAHQLKLNPSKTELLVIPGDPSPAQDLALSLNNSMISPSATARNLGVTMDNQLSFSSHVTNVTRSCQCLLYNIRRIRPFLSTQATQVLVQSLVISTLDYCNSLLGGLPLNAIRPLQMIQNTAARLVFNLPKFSHTTPLLLHWLPVAARIRFKTLMLAYKAKNGPAPSYLKALVTPRTAPRSLRSSSTARLVPPSLRQCLSSKMKEKQCVVFDTDPTGGVCST